MYRNKSGFHGGREAGGCKASPLLELSSSVLSQSESSLGGPCEEEQKCSEVRLSRSGRSLDSMVFRHQIPSVRARPGCDLQLPDKNTANLLTILHALYQGPLRLCPGGTGLTY